MTRSARGPHSTVTSPLVTLHAPIWETTIVCIASDHKAKVNRLAGRSDLGELNLGVATHHHHEIPSKQLDAIDLNAREAAASSRTVLDQSKDWQQSDKYHKIVGWLAPPEPSSNHNAARRRHEPNTGAWLLESETYRRWKASPNSRIWLHGKAGCGKSVLCSTVIEDLRTLCDVSADTAFAYFYFSFSETQKQTCTDLLKSLVLQLCQLGRSREKLEEAYDRSHLHAPSTGLLEGLLRFSLQQSDRALLVMDALDELGDGDDGKEAVFD